MHETISKKVVVTQTNWPSSWMALGAIFLSGILTSSLNHTSLDATRMLYWLCVYTVAHTEHWDRLRRESWCQNGHLSGSPGTWRALSWNTGVLDDA